jgi:predicted nucleic acid-binding protein
VKTAVDSSVLLDVLGADPQFGEASREALRSAYDAGALIAGELWRQRPKKSEEDRKRVVADFLIGAHSQVQADALLTRDRGFFRRYFRSLKILSPAA